MGHLWGRPHAIPGERVTLIAVPDVISEGGQSQGGLSVPVRLSRRDRVRGPEREKPSDPRAAGLNAGRSRYLRRAVVRPKAPNLLCIELMRANTYVLGAGQAQDGTRRFMILAGMLLC
jgi:hypothetical protein